MTKEELAEYRWIIENVSALESEIQGFRDMLDLKSPLWSDMPSSKAEGDKMATIISQIVDTRDTLISYLRKALTKRTEIEDAIEFLPERERALIRYRYIYLKTWVEICEIMHYELRNVHKVHSKALELLRK